jgi:hypothetical protein
MGYSIAQQTELAVINAYHRMRHAALLLENLVVFKLKGASYAVTTLALDAAQALLETLRAQKHVLKKKTPFLLSNYSYSKQIFDAGVVFGVLCTLCASFRTVARAAADGLKECIQMIKELELWFRSKNRAPGSSNGPALQVLEGFMVEVVHTSRKRTRFEMEEARWCGLVLPYIMGGWVFSASMTSGDDDDLYRHRK